MLLGFLIRCQFHQHFMSSFCTKILLPKNYKPSTQTVRKKLWYEKAACKILLKLTVIPKFFAQLLSAYNLGL